MGYDKISQKLTFYKAFFSPQWKFLIHTILQCLSSKTTAWNEFSSTMASAIICLATNQKFNFSKYIFESMVKNLENVSGKFLMYPRFVQVFLEKQLEGMSNHNRIHVSPSRLMGQKELFCSFIYAHNRYIQRRELWQNLLVHKNYIRNRPWCITGDFNVSLFADDRSTGTSTVDTGMRDFQDCVEAIEISDVNSSGLRYTWNQKPKGMDGVLKKIDRVMANLEFSNCFVGACAVFQPYRISDHAPAIIRLPMNSLKKPRPFKFYNMLVHNTRFKEVVANGWNIEVSGFWMFKVVKKLKNLKKPLRKLLYDYGNLNDNVNKLRLELDAAQKALDADPSNMELKEEEAAYLLAFQDALLNQERLLKEKSKAARNRIDSITTAGGVCIDQDQVPIAFINHYTEFLGQSGETTKIQANDMFCNRLSEDVANSMIRDVTDKEIKEAMFSLGDNKAPGPDGYSASFFKDAWDIVVADVIKAIKEYFTIGILLKELNHTIIALIMKIIYNRMKEGLSDLVSLNQSTFMPGHRISDNILLTQELMHNYHLDRGPMRCAFKVDIQKAYDTVDWRFLKKILIGFGFHARMVGWIMECVISTSFSISINGCLHGYFKGKRGLQQGDLMSPYLFTLVMEVLTLILKKKANESEFTYHRYCSKLNIINLCFADDLFLFAHGDIQSARVIMESMEVFKTWSGLIPSLPKSKAYFCNVLNYVKLGILNILPFEEGILLVKYLGVPLVPSRLLYRDCSELMEKVKGRIKDWKNKALSLAGRAQLIRSVIGSMHLFWASVFIIPSRLLLELEQVMRGFLWCQGELRKGKAKVAWEAVCLPKVEGGLGIRRLEDFNKALISSHIWHLLMRKETLWVLWIHSYKLHGRSFWDVPIRGNGTDTFAWFDNWCPHGPLSNIVSNRDIYRSGFTHNAKVADVVNNNMWPTEWSSKYLLLNNIVMPHLSNAKDELFWKDLENKEVKFLVSAVWENIRPRSIEVDWFSVVWFSQQIPRHAILIWLIIKRKLKTQDVLRQWNIAPVGDALSRKERVKSRRVRGMILVAQSEAFKQENVLTKRLRGLDQQMERKGDKSLYFMDRIWVLLVGSVMDEAHASSKEWNSGDDQLRLRCMIYLVVLVDAAESVRDAIGFEYCLASSRGWITIRCSPFEALYGRKSRSPILWAEIRESSLTGPELVQNTTDKVVLIKENLKAARDRQKSYANKRRKPLEFEVGDRVLLKVSPWKGVVRFGKKGKLAPRYVGSFEILERIGLVAYRLRLPEEWSSVHDTFRVSNLKKCLADDSLHVSLDEIKVDMTLHFIKEPIEIMEREIKKLKRKKIALVKVRWNSKRGPKFT
ncbi:hypothetical protein Tco_1577446, partial [Tanacetum coccineum]